MIYSNKKIKLSKRLSLGVGREPGKYNIYKIGTSIFLVISAALVMRAGYLLINHSNNQNPQVLGAVDKSSYQEYVVKSGDTLFSIAAEYQVDWTALATLNNLKAPFNLKPLDTIKIPQK